MAVKVTYQVISEQALKGLDGLDLRCRNLFLVLQDFTGYMMGSVQRNFDAQGRPGRWAPLKLSTMSGWIGSRKTWSAKAGGLSKTGREALAGRRILTDTARLRNSIRFAVVAGGRGVEGSTNVKYAAIQHKGGTVQIPAFGPRKKKALFWPGAAHPVKMVRAHSVTIPPRPFLMFQNEDIYGYLFPRLAGYVEGR